MESIAEAERIRSEPERVSKSRIRAAETRKHHRAAAEAGAAAGGGGD
jgi:hypothetical protein